MADLSGWAQASVAGLVAAVGTVFWAGNTNNVIHTTQERVEVVAKSQQDDHDKVTSLNSKLDDVQTDITEIKQDIKTLLENDSKKRR